YGSLGENILLDFDPHKFNVGEIFNIGDTSIQITQICSICSHLSIFHKKLPSLLSNNRGLYCKILSSGIIKKDMKVQINSK
ncbi:MAG: MOSC domain-containing protein, partial [Arcobacter sp.]|nr:MOSC domain-containing protein [Arcobacter sp.]